MVYKTIHDGGGGVGRVSTINGCETTSTEAEDIDLKDMNRKTSEFPTGKVFKIMGK